MKTNIDPGEIDPEEVRRLIGLTPNTVNSDNSWLEPIGCVGHVSEVNGENAREVPGFVPTRQELSVLVKYWTIKIIDYDFFVFCYEQTSSSDSRRKAFASRRIARIEAFIGADAVERAVNDAYEEYGQTTNSEAWRIFLHGTDEEFRAFRAESIAMQDAMAREHEDRFYANILKFLAGEPHDLREGTVGMAWADIAKILVNENPTLAAPENKERLLKAIRDREISGHGVGPLELD